MRISELLSKPVLSEGRPKGSKNKKKAVKPKIVKSRKSDTDDLEPVPADPDQDKIPNILMQVRKAIDVDGDMFLHFSDGRKHKIDMDDLRKFAQTYIAIKPSEREAMQAKAIQNLQGFYNSMDQNTSKMPKSIY